MKAEGVLRLIVLENLLTALDPNNCAEGGMVTSGVTIRVSLSHECI